VFKPERRNADVDPLRRLGHIASEAHKLQDLSHVVLLPLFQSLSNSPLVSDVSVLPFTHLFELVRVQILIETRRPRTQAKLFDVFRGIYEDPTPYCRSVGGLTNLLWRTTARVITGAICRIQQASRHGSVGSRTTQSFRKTNLDNLAIWRLEGLLRGFKHWSYQTSLHEQHFALCVASCRANFGCMIYF
jgi:hypothetical protein